MCLGSTKTCFRCKTEKRGLDFGKCNGNPDGLQTYCKDCRAEIARLSSKKNKSRETITIPDFKTCPWCKIEKSGLGFHKSSKNTDGLDSYCKECSFVKKKAHRKKNLSRCTIVIPDVKTCSGCNTEKSGLDFNKSGRNTDGLNDCCKDCASVRNRKRLYGASPEWIKATLEAQGGACAICRWIPGSGDRGLDLDHKHGGKPRGFLCGKCNRGLGYFKDDPGLIGNAIEYLSGPTLGIVYKRNLSKVIKDAILASQNYKCKICSIDLTKKNTCFDHCHDSGMVRGALCRSCNCGLGQFDDSVELLKSAVNYLISF